MFLKGTMNFRRPYDQMELVPPPASSNFWFSLQSPFRVPVCAQGDVTPRASQTGADQQVLVDDA
eukprot:157255-Amphidinium_carterae.1